MSTIKLNENLYVRLRADQSGKVTSFDFYTPWGGKAWVGPKLRSAFAKAIKNVGPPMGDEDIEAWKERMRARSKDYREMLAAWIGKTAKGQRTHPGTRMLKL